MPNERGGGEKFNKQIGRVENCKLKRVGDLAREMDLASCAATGSAIIMCFPTNGERRCFEGSTPFNIIEPLDSSEHEHYFTYIASSEGQFSYL